MKCASGLIEWKCESVAQVTSSDVSAGNAHAVVVYAGAQTPEVRSTLLGFGQLYVAILGASVALRAADGVLVLPVDAILTRQSYRLFEQSVGILFSVSFKDLNEYYQSIRLAEWFGHRLILPSSLRAIRK